ncbi:hypothetical protein ACS0TY_025261 [Phlomoides rotata]
MADNSASLAKWREYFRTANSDIFTVIEHAILIAASDYPYDFKQNRDRIAELLFTCKVTKCFGCDRVELAVPNDDGLENTEEKINSAIDFAGSKDSKESKANSSSRDNEDDLREVMGINVNPITNYSYEDAEALTDEIEQESRTMGEVLRIKETFDGDAMPEPLLLNCLRRLRLMNLSVETLKATDIGKSVNAMRKHRSKEIQNLARTLIEDWKVTVDTFLSATAAFAESAKTSPIEDEEGLPSPPLDEGIFFSTPTSMELSQFFDGIDDDGNPKTSEDLNKNQESGRRPTLHKIDTRSEKPSDSHTPPKDKKVELKRNPEAMLMKAHAKPNRPCTDESEPGRPRPLNTGFVPVRSKPSVKPKVNNGTTIQQTSENRPIQKKPMPPQHEANCVNESSIGFKLEAAKRKLHERYQEAENAKKQRTVQVVELHELPKNSHGNRNQHMRPGNHNRQGRR